MTICENNWYQQQQREWSSLNCLNTTSSAFDSMFTSQITAEVRYRLHNNVWASGAFGRPTNGFGRGINAFCDFVFHTVANAGLYLPKSGREHCHSSVSSVLNANQLLHPPRLGLWIFVTRCDDPLALDHFTHYWSLFGPIGPCPKEKDTHSKIR